MRREEIMYAEDDTDTHHQRGNTHNGGGAHLKEALVSPAETSSSSSLRDGE